MIGIKFRLWNSKSQTMHYTIPCEVPDGRDLNEVFKFIENVPELSLMQFTGLTDRSGREIYEGDIVENWDGNMQEVRFGTHLVRTDDYDPTAHGFYLYRDGMTDGMDSDDDYLVIGNIYENPELLGGADGQQ